ncbi:DUF262 domain-containing protein [Fulvivirga lutimaris]|uniref:DUF262 domain-containing protein n=1 Tax=Fulvivirga lutimaris TaxID=1819566 RepID=UPI0012BCA708|nr:DUF262 domain-containing protein [Fulvivirga lutimaris]MTI41253.1 DUF262 domain-containing protein [Fulvivirga lutimaris]
MDELEENLEFEDQTTGNDEVDEIPTEVRRISTQAYDKSVADLIRMMEDDDIRLNPEYQRNYVWDNKRASLLIESIILNVPIPIVYVSQEEDDTWTVIDGLQRLNSLKRFFDRDFKITGLEILSDLNRSDVRSLNPKALRILKNGLIRVIMISHDSHPEIKYDVFMRLNKGSVKLTEQELRNCLYRGSLNECIKSLAHNEDMLTLLNLSEPHKRMMDCELILRFLALHGNWDMDTWKVDRYKGRMKIFLNEFMQRNQNVDEVQIQGYSELFNTTIAKVLSVMGEKAFRRINAEGEFETSLNRSIMDVLMVSFARIDADILAAHSDSIRDLLKELIVVDDLFRDSVTIGTSDVKVIEYRLKRWYEELTNVIGG